MLNPGDTLRTTSGEMLVIDRLLGEGGQGWAYVVNMNDAQKVLKLYKPHMAEMGELFFRNLQSNSLSEPPSGQFVWVQDIVHTGELRGYVMDFVGKPYKSFSKFLLDARHGTRFASYKITVDAMLNIVSAFNRLHTLGYSYQDLNEGNFMFDPATGDVRIIDNDNVAPNGVNTGIIGKARYIAPEVILGKTRPNTQSDRFSLAVILFMMLFISHPLEGKRYLVPLLTDEMERWLYAEGPIFVMDPNDDRNGPDENVHTNLLAVWKWVPEPVKALFCRAFSQEALHDPEARVTETEWENVLIPFRASLATCAFCDGETPYAGQAPFLCADCGQPMPDYALVTSRGAVIPASHGAVVTSGQLRYCNVGHSVAHEWQIRRSKSDHHALFLVNCAGNDARVILTDDTEHPLPDGRFVQLSAVKHVLTGRGETIEVQPMA